jgi:hypothetical protein
MRSKELWYEAQDAIIMKYVENYQHFKVTEIWRMILAKNYPELKERGSDAIYQHIAYLRREHRKSL